MSIIDDAMPRQVAPSVDLEREEQGSNSWLKATLILCCVITHVAFGIWLYTHLRADEIGRHVASVKLAVDREAITQNLLFNNSTSIAQFVGRLERSSDIRQAYIFDQVDRLDKEGDLDEPTQIYQLHKNIIESAALATIVDDVSPLTIEWLYSLIDPSNVHLHLAMQLYDRNQRRGALVLSMNVEQELIKARSTAVQIYSVSTAAILLILLLVMAIRRHHNRRSIPEQSAMDAQIERLEDLLDQARNHHKALRTASSHAVQLNEQFLRRVGSDLHDGPAQSVSYAILRLREYPQDWIVEQVGAEHYAILESLEGALQEIRGISKGLVLPELENHSLQQCIHKVVALNRTLHRGLEIEEHYVDLPMEIDMGIKICVYRFVQEGLNNASRHGQASRCRVVANFQGSTLTVSLKDDGMGFRVSKLGSETNRLGLIGLRDRIESIGGKFSINSVLGVGTALKLTISLAENGVEFKDTSTPAS